MPLSAIADISWTSSGNIISLLSYCSWSKTIVKLWRLKYPTPPVPPVAENAPGAPVPPVPPLCPNPPVPPIAPVPPVPPVPPVSPGAPVDEPVPPVNPPPETHLTIPYVGVYQLIWIISLSNKAIEFG